MSDLLKLLADGKDAFLWLPPFEQHVPRFDAPLSPRRERSAKLNGDNNKKDTQISVTGFNRIDNTVSLIKSETAQDDEFVILPRTACLKIFVSMSMKEVD
ncbi:hypothetical protein TNCV_680211 [Trichonephila clavipes]|nr:hypothetical protein TNCV_680211 [Trichonephila clavipes]